MPAVSVIIPVFQRRDLASAAIRSVLAQSFQDFEILVVDDGSSPAFVADSHDARIRVLMHEKNLGAAAARNTGIQAAQGEWIAFLDSDDTWQPEKLEKQMAFSRNQQSDMTAFTCGFTMRGTTRKHDKALIPIEASHIETFAAGCWFCPGSTLLIKKTVFDAVGPFDTTLKRLEDYKWFLRFAAKGGALKTVPDILADINIGARPMPATIEVAADYIQQKLSAMQTDQNVKRNANAFLSLEYAAACLRSGKILPGFLALLQSFWLKPRLHLHVKKFWTLAK
ncbi:MAG: glycosyltransferase [Pseudomonadota bacterium]